MNLLAKKLIKKYLLKPGLMLLIPVFFGCDTQEDIGIQYDLGSDASVKYVEFTLPATNIYIDSLRTDGENRIHVGNFSDELTGSISAEGYFQFFYESGPLPRAKTSDDVPTTVDTLQLDSLIIWLESNVSIPISGNSYQEFSVYDLQDSLVSEAIYLSSTKQVTVSEIGSYSSPINIETDTLFRIKLGSTFAQNFFFELSDIAGDPDQFIGSTVFKSLGIVPGSSAEAITSFDLTSDTTRMIMYSSPTSASSNDTTYLTYFGFTGKHYTYLNRDRSTSAFNGIEEYENFDLPNGQTVIDPLAGITTAFTISELADFFEQNSSIIVNSAIVSYEFESSDNRDTLVNFMSYFRKPDGSIFGPSIASNPFGNIVMSDNAYLSLESNPAFGSLSEDKTKILTSSALFHQQLYRQYLEENDLVFLNPTNGVIRNIDDLVLISPADLTLQQTIFKKDGVKLRVYYTEVEQ